MLQFGHPAPGSASAQPASLGPCFGNILKGKRRRRNGGSHKWSTAAHHLLGYEKESPDIEADELEAAGALFSLAAMAAEMEPAQPADSGGYVPPARRKGGRGAQQQRKRKREPESRRQQAVWKAEQAAGQAPPAGLRAPLQDAESQHAAAHGYSMLNHSAAVVAGRREHAAGGLQAPNGLGSRPAPSSWQAAQQLQQEPAQWRPGQDLPARSDAQGLPRGVRLPWRRGPNHVYIACMIEQLQEEESRQARRQQLSAQQQPKAAPQPPRQQGFTSFQSQGGAAGGFSKPPARHHAHPTHSAAAVAGGFEELPAPSQQHHGHQHTQQQQPPHRMGPAEAAAAADALPEPHANKHHQQQQLPGNGLAGFKWEQHAQAAQLPPLREQQAPQPSQGYGPQPGGGFSQQQQQPPALSGTQAFPMLPASLGLGQLRAAAGQAGFQLPDMLQGGDPKTMAARMLLQGLNGSWTRDAPFSGAGGLSAQQAAALGMGVLGQPPFSLGSLPLPGLQAQMAASQAMAQVHGQQQQGGPTFQRDSGQPQGVKAEPVPSEESTKDELSSAILQQQQQQQGVLGGDLPQQQGHPHVDLLARLKALSNSAAALNGQNNFPHLNGLNGLPTDLLAAMRQAEQQQQPKNGQRPPSQAAVPVMR